MPWPRKLNDEEIRRMRRLAADGDLSHKKIADAFDVTRAYVSLVVNGHRRVEAGGPIQDSDPPTRLTDDQVRRIRELSAAGEYSRDELADMYDVSRSYISTLVRGGQRIAAGGPVQVTKRTIVAARDLDRETDEEDEAAA